MKLAWIDIETTGLNPQFDIPLELAIVLTEADGSFLGSYTVLVKQDLTGLRVHPRVEEMHHKSRLWDDLEKFRDGLKTSDELDSLLCFWIKSIVGDEPELVLAGSSVHFDRSFIKVHFPKLDAKLHYRHVDVSVFNTIFNALAPERAYPKGNGKHRAWDDILGSLSMYRHYLQQMRIKVAPKNPGGWIGAVKKFWALDSVS